LTAARPDRHAGIQDQSLANDGRPGACGALAAFLVLAGAVVAGGREERAVMALREWHPGDRVILSGVPGDLARLEGVRATVVSVNGATAVIRFDSAKLLGGRMRREIEVGVDWLLEEPRPPVP
jgi:hypothetical protein